MTTGWLDRLGRTFLGGALLGLSVVPFLAGHFSASLLPLRGTPMPQIIAAAYGATLLVATVITLSKRGGMLGPLMICALAALLIGSVHAPMLIDGGGKLLLWLPPGEIVVLAAGALLCVAKRRAARILVAPALFYFGALHVVYLKFVANLIPAWIPFHPFLTVATGSLFAFSGVSLAIDRAVRPVLAALGVMMSIFVVVLHAPLIASELASEAQWTSGLIALGFAGVGFLLAGTSGFAEDRSRDDRDVLAS